jgi:hypothetical protein
MDVLQALVVESSLHCEKYACTSFKDKVERKAGLITLLIRAKS